MAEYPELELSEIRETTMQARKGAVEAVLSLKDQLVKLNTEEFLRVWVLSLAKGDNYCCAGCGPAYKGKSEIAPEVAERRR
jgi:hypothetical protein